ncbi:MAG: hypothetical protein GW941_02795 [Candidatus Pacebacteria bacterium]|nr:hypothetical protein [Candidatus Paceibacterota bacterium]
MKVINSKNTWYLIFGVLTIIILTIIVFNLIFKRTEEKITGSNRETLITQQEPEKNGIKVIKASPTPSPKASKRPLFTFINESPEASPSPSPTPNIKDEESVIATVTTTKGGQNSSSNSGSLALVKEEDGILYLSAENEDGSEDIVSQENSNVFIQNIIIPEGFATDVGEYINRLLRFVMMISALLVFAQLIWGGIEWITSGGDKGKVDSARGKITAAVIGLIIVASSYAILHLSLNFIGFQSLNEVLDLL